MLTIPLKMSMRTRIIATGGHLKAKRAGIEKDLESVDMTDKSFREIFEIQRLLKI